jgi:predicted transcriptional regulator
VTPRTRIDVDRVRGLVSSGFSQAEIAQRLGRPSGSISRLISREGIRYVHRELDVKEVQDLLDEGLAQKEIARLLDWSETVVCRFIQGRGLVRSPEGARKEKEALRESLSASRRGRRRRRR